MIGASPLVTIGIPSYECADFIGEAISSALAQGFTDLEVLVIDDRSSDATVEVARGFDDPRVRLLINEVNLGPALNWNKVLLEARGRYIKLMGCDDVLLPGSIAAQVAVLEADPAVVICTGARDIITESGRRVMRRGNGPLKGRVAGRDAGREMVRRGANLVGEPCAALLRASAVEEVGGFNEGNPYCIDMEMWLRLLEVGDVYVLDRPVCGYRIVGTSWSHTVADTQDADVIELLEETVARGAFGATEADVASGTRATRSHAVGRRLVYRVLFDVEMHRRIKYLIVGGWNTLFGYLVFSGIFFLLGAKVGSAPVLIASYILGVLNNYWCYKIFVFKSKGMFVREFPRFAIVYVVVLAVNLVVFPWLTKTLGLNAYVSQAMFSVVVIITTYIVNKRFSFRQEPMQ
jgi:glycosyltransferase involved in cell wall biosynthesis